MGIIKVVKETYVIDKSRVMKSPKFLTLFRFNPCWGQKYLAKWLLFRSYPEKRAMAFCN